MPYEFSESGTVDYIYRAGPDTNGKYIPWLVIAPSAVLHRKQTKGIGLYVAKHFAKDVILAKYHIGKDEAIGGFSCIVNNRSNTRLGVNCVLTEHGYLKITRSNMPAFNLNADIAGNVDSELRTA